MKKIREKKCENLMNQLAKIVCTDGFITTSSK